MSTCISTGVRDKYDETGSTELTSGELMEVHRVVIEAKPGAALLTYKTYKRVKPVQ